MNTADTYAKLAVTDYLTGLPNRRGLYDYYASLAKDEAINVMFIDIDNFKKVNDTYGHRTGDDLLIAVTTKIKNTVPGSFVARIGGDEFVIILTQDRQKTAIISIAENMLASVYDLAVSVDVKALISLSIGIILRQKAQSDLDDVLFKCDAAMYHAKKNGKNNYVLYDAIEPFLRYKHQVELEMRKALIDKQFEIYLQPQINIINSRAVSAEVEICWNHPVDGLRTADQFVPLFEENGFIVELDSYMLEELCRIRKKYADHPLRNIPFFVTVSHLHIFEPDFTNRLLALTGKYQVQPREFIIAFSDCKVPNLDEMKRTIDELNVAGFITAIDQVGAGEATFTMFRAIDVSVLKLNRDFFGNHEIDQKNKAIIRNLISMSKELHLDFVADNVKSKAQEAFLTDCGCNYAQGYLYCAPLKAGEAKDYFMEHVKGEDLTIRYHFNNSLSDEKDGNEGHCYGNITFDQGVWKNTGSLYFHGGEPMENIVQLPVDVLNHESFTVSMWVKAEILNNWTSIFYARSNNGFLSIMPYAWQRVPMFRFKDGMDANGWYDAIGVDFLANEWTFLAVTYNQKTALSRIYQNGKLVGKKENVFPIDGFKQVILGGDHYQNTFTGLLSELWINREAATDEEIMDLYRSFTDSPDFVGK